MSAEHLELKLCVSCGSTKILEDYPAPGLSICCDCGREVACVPLKVISEDYEEEFLCKNYVCPHCHKKDDSDDLLNNDDGFVVLKCNACGKLDGYKVLPSTGMSNEDWINDGNFDGKAAFLAKNEGHFVFSASATQKIVKDIQEHQNDPVVLCQRSFERLLEEKTEGLNRLGLDRHAIDYARVVARKFIASKGPFTENQLEYLLCGVIVFAQDELPSINKSLEEISVNRNSQPAVANRVSERKISELLNVDRATTGKWKKMVIKDRKR